MSEFDTFSFILTNPRILYKIYIRTKNGKAGLKINAETQIFAYFCFRDFVRAPVYLPRTAYPFVFFLRPVSYRIIRFNIK